MTKFNRRKEKLYYPVKPICKPKGNVVDVFDGTNGMRLVAKEVEMGKITEVFANYRNKIKRQGCNYETRMPELPIDNKKSRRRNGNMSKMWGENERSSSQVSRNFKRRTFQKRRRRTWSR